jgi:hypothetical protein
MQKQFINKSRKKNKKKVTSKISPVANLFISSDLTAPFHPQATAGALSLASSIP